MISLGKKNYIKNNKIIELLDPFEQEFDSSNVSNSL